jgi:hypothetical protein
MKRIIASLMVTAFLISGCTFEMQVLTPEPPTTDISTPTEIVFLPTPTLIPTVESLFPTPTKAPTEPQFFNAKFTLDPGTAIYQNIFPAKTKRIYVVWEYLNMRDGMIVRRDWYYNDGLWITREEPWDFAKYGASGTMRDISVYELQSGLLSGDYRFELYIDSQPQPIFGGLNWPTFTISQNEFSAQAVSPNGSRVAFVHDRPLLSVVDQSGTLQEMYSGTEITNLAWLPDSKHLIFVDRDRSQQNEAGMGILDDLWIINVETGQSLLLYQDNGPLLKQLLVSSRPDGTYFVAAVEGSDYADACLVDARVVIFEINQEFEASSRYVHEDFTGFPSGPDMFAYPSDQGQWLSHSQFKVPLDFTCTTDTTLKGFYIFNLDDLSVAKVN